MAIKPTIVYPSEPKLRLSLGRAAGAGDAVNPIPGGLTTASLVATPLPPLPGAETEKPFAMGIAGARRETATAIGSPNRYRYRDRYRHRQEGSLSERVRHRARVRTRSRSRSRSRLRFWAGGGMLLGRVQEQLSQLAREPLAPGGRGVGVRGESCGNLLRLLLHLALVCGLGSVAPLWCPAIVLAGQFFEWFLRCLLLCRNRCSGSSPSWS